MTACLPAALRRVVFCLQYERNGVIADFDFPARPNRKYIVKLRNHGNANIKPARLAARAATNYKRCIFRVIRPVRNNPLFGYFNPNVIILHPPRLLGGASMERESDNMTLPALGTF
jgi:hypothetical protein